MLVTQKIENILTERIISNHYANGDKIPSIRSLSEELSASYVMVSRAVDSLKKRGLVMTYPGRGTFALKPDSPFVRSGVRKVCFVFADPIENPQEEYQIKVYSYVQSKLRELGFIDQALQFSEEVISAPETLAGVIVTHRSPLLPWLRENKIPVVYCSSQGRDIPFSSISPDFYSGSYLVTKYLINSGHRKIGMVTAADIDNKSSFISREQGYADAMNDAKLDSSMPVRWHVLSAYEELAGLLKSHDRPTALFIGNDHMAVEVMQLARELKIRIPDDLSIAGLENMRCSQLSSTKLTTAGYNEQLLAAETVRLLVDLINGRESGIVTKKIPMELVIRDSVSRI